MTRNELPIMPMTRQRRKALFVEAGISYSAVAEGLQVDVATVSRVANGLTKRETEKAKAIREELARRVGIPATTLWPTAA